MSKDKDFFEKYGLQVQAEKPALGQEYMLYGMITGIKTQKPLVVEINFNIYAEVITDSEENMNTIKERAFEPGIFNCILDTYDEVTGIYTGTCSTVIFGKKVEYNEQ